jgi:hypothetical protein
MTGGRGIRSEGPRLSSQPFRAASRRCPGRASLARCRRTGTCVVGARPAYPRSASAPRRSTSGAVHTTSPSPEPESSTGLPRDRTVPDPGVTIAPQTERSLTPGPPKNARRNPRVVCELESGGAPSAGGAPDNEAARQSRVRGVEVVSHRFPRRACSIPIASNSVLTVSTLKQREPSHDAPHPGRLFLNSGSQGQGIRALRSGGWMTWTRTPKRPGPAGPGLFGVDGAPDRSAGRAPRPGRSRREGLPAFRDQRGEERGEDRERDGNSEEAGLERLLHVGTPGAIAGAYERGAALSRHSRVAGVAHAWNVGRGAMAGPWDVRTMGPA